VINITIERHHREASDSKMEEQGEESRKSLGVDFYLKCTPDKRIALSCFEEASSGLTSLPILEFFSGNSDNAHLIRGLLLGVPRASIEQLYLVESSFRSNNLNASCLTSPVLQRLYAITQMKEREDEVTSLLDKAFNHLALELPRADRDLVPVDSRKLLVHRFFGQPIYCTQINFDRIPSLPCQKDVLAKAIVIRHRKLPQHSTNSKRQKMLQVNDVVLAEQTKMEVKQ
jgi:hypothetical protein